MAAQVNPGLLIEVDGGIALHNAGLLLKAGANVLVAGNAVFAAPSPTEMITELKLVDKDIAQLG